jgi:CRISPR-associated protein Csx17
MTLHQHHLAGCSPSPLAGYLKALGVLRLLAEQADPEVRGAWRDEAFVLWTRLDADALHRFFLHAYAPTALVSPWNKGSGFMGDADAALRALEGSVARRFAPFREGIAAGRAVNDAIGEADAAIREIKAEPKRLAGTRERDALRASEGYKNRLADAERRFKRLKADVIPACRRAWRGSHLDWYECAVVLTGDGDPKYPSLLGTGGNDGRFDMTNNAMQRLGDLFELESPEGGPRPDAESALAEALWGAPARDRVDSAIGQFLPGAAGGFNSTAGPSGDATVNRWDFVLALEGAVAFRAGAARRLGAEGPVLGSAPFAVYSHAAGYGSAGPVDEGGRGEQWMPLWERPASWVELRQLLAEGRAQLGRARTTRPLDLMRAVTRLGVARGVTAFVRYGYMERNGQSNFSVPLGRVRVGDFPRARLVDDLAPWLDRLHQKARTKGATGSLQAVERRLADAVMEALAHAEESRRWQQVLLAAADAESLLVPGGARNAGPIPPLRADWISAADDGSPEFRLALALGTARAGTRGAGWPVDPIRGHLLPLDERGRLRTLGGGLEPRLAADPRVLPRDAGPLEALMLLVERRLVEAERGSARRLPLVAAPGLGARLPDLAAFLDGRLDDERILGLVRAFAALRLQGAASVEAPRGPLPDDAWLVLRLAHPAGPLPGGRAMPCDPSILRRLRASDPAGALAIALRRLRAAGLALPLHCGSTDAPRARRWAAALAFPLHPHALASLFRHLCPSSKENSHVQ